METRLVIIGAGVAGLTAACYAARSGYRVTVLEMAATPGGLCTSWRRQGYRFDASAAGLAGSAPGTPIYRLWQDLGVIDHCPLHDPDTFGSIVGPGGRTVAVYTDIDRLEAHLRERFPRDAGAIRELAAALRACLDVEIPFRTQEGWAGLLEGLQLARGSLRSLPTLVRYGRVTLREFAARLVDPFFVDVFHNLVHFGGPDVPLLTVLLPLAYAHRRMTGIPRHGWLSFARAVERRVVELGAQVRYRARVARLLVAGGAARGVALADGTEISADRVLSAADGRFTRTVLLGEPAHRCAARFDPRRISDQPVQVNLGVAEDWAAVTGPLTYLLPDAPAAAGRPQRRLTVHNNCFDPAAAPPGKSALTAFLESSYDFWRPLAADRPAYEAQKERCARMVVDAIARHRPGFAGKVEVEEVATPLTRERLTGNWMGAMQARKPDASIVRSLLQGGARYEEPGVKGLYVAGQWVEAWGGITTAAQSGRNAIRALCRRDGRPFAGA